MAVPEDSYIWWTAMSENPEIEMGVVCRRGTCTSCAALVISGTYFQYSDDENPNGLCDEAVKDGYILPCCAYPRSDMVIRLGVEEEYMNRYGDA
jgi:ferredoxin